MESCRWPVVDCLFRIPPQYRQLRSREGRQNGARQPRQDPGDWQGKYTSARLLAQHFELADNVRNREYNAIERKSVVKGKRMLNRVISRGRRKNKKKKTQQ